MTKYIIFISLVISQFALAQERPTTNIENPKKIDEKLELEAKIDELVSIVKQQSVEIDNLKKQNDLNMNTIKSTSELVINSTNKKVEFMYNVYLIVGSLISTVLVILAIFGFKEFKNIKDTVNKTINDQTKIFGEKITQSEGILENLEERSSQIDNIMIDEKSKFLMDGAIGLVKSGAYGLGIKKIKEIFEFGTTDKRIRSSLYAVKAKAYKRMKNYDTAYNLIKTAKEIQDEINETHEGETNYFILYNYACYASLIGFHEEACKTIKEIIEVIPEWKTDIVSYDAKSNTYKLEDSDFKNLIKLKKFKDLLGINDFEDIKC